MQLYQFAWTGMYSRDWELACEFWIATKIKTRFIVHSDDDAILCAQTLTRSLGLLPRPAKIYRVFVASPGLFLWWLMKRQYLALASSSPLATGRAQADNPKTWGS